jgi:transposase
MGRKSRFSNEVRERAVRLVREQAGEHEPEWATITSVASKLGCAPETLRGWVAQKKREVRELRMTNGILRKASAFVAQAELGLRPR